MSLLARFEHVSAAVPVSVVRVTSARRKAIDCGEEKHVGVESRVTAEPPPPPPGDVASSQGAIRINRRYTERSPGVPSKPQATNSEEKQQIPLHFKSNNNNKNPCDLCANLSSMHLLRLSFPKWHHDSGTHY